MAKDREAGKFVSPENLWAKPVPGAKKEPAQTKATRMRTKDEDNMEDEDIDVDAELEAEDAYGDEIEEDADAELAAEADDDTDVGDDADDDEDEIDYESEDGDEDIAATDETETAVSAVDADDVDVDDETDESEVVSTKESRTTKMAEKKKTSLSDHVRNEIEKRKTSGASLRGVDIVAALEKRGINVSAAQVSQLLKKAGLSSGKKGRPSGSKSGGEAGERPRAALKAGKKPAEEPKARATVSRKPAAEPMRVAPKATAKTGNGFNVPMQQLSAASDFVAACGGSFDKASRILAAAEKLSQSFDG